MSQINGFVKSRIRRRRRRKKSGWSGKISEVGRTGSKGKVLLVRRTSGGLLRLGLDRGLLQLLLRIGQLVSLSSSFASASASSSSPLPISALLVLLLLELGVLVVLPFNHAELVSSLLVTLGTAPSRILPTANHSVANLLNVSYPFLSSVGRKSLDHYLHVGGSFREEDKGLNVIRDFEVVYS